MKYNALFQNWVILIAKKNTNGTFLLVGGSIIFDKLHYLQKSMGEDSFDTRRLVAIWFLLVFNKYERGQV